MIHCSVSQVMRLIEHFGTSGLTDTLIVIINRWGFYCFLTYMYLKSKLNISNLEKFLDWKCEVLDNELYISSRLNNSSSYSYHTVYSFSYYVLCINKK